MTLRRRQFLHLAASAAALPALARGAWAQTFPTRPITMVVAFGAGVHMCLGATLARMEGTIALDRFIRRFPAYRRDGDFVRGGRARFRGFAKYPVAW